MARLKVKYNEEIAPALLKKFGYKSVMQIPKLDKVIVNVGCGEAKDNAKIIDNVIRDIAAIMLGELKTSLDGRGIALSWDESLVDFLVKEAYSITYGARNLRRTIQKHVEDPIAEKIIDSCFEPIRAISLTAQDGAVKLETK